MFLNHTNLTISAVRDALNETSYDLASLCQSSNINKWGLFRYYFDGGDQLRPFTALTTTATDHLSEMTASPYELGDFRGYHHAQLAPGWYTSFNGTQLPLTGTMLSANVNAAGAGGSGNAITMYFVSIGAYEIEISYGSGSDWVTVLEPLVEQVGGDPTVIGAHTYETDIDGNLTGGRSFGSEVGPLASNALYGKVRIVLSNNGGSSRTVDIRLKNANSYLGSSLPYRLRIVQYANTFAVQNLTHHWLYTETNAKFSYVTVPYLVGWSYSAQSISLGSDEEWWGSNMSITKSTGSDGSGSLRFQPNSNTGNWKKRKGVIRVSRDDTSAYYDITLTQDNDPSITPP